ncbi:MAG: ATP-binding protein [Phycisphaerae bacterium]|jgi:signal transduction histidine kinase
MSIAREQVEAAAAGQRLRRCLWNGVLPEALGLCFVAIIFAGFTAAYLISDRAWARQTVAGQQAQAQTLAQALAVTLGSLGEDEQQRAEDAIKQFTRLPHVRSVCWMTPSGEVRLSWPPSLRPLATLPEPEDGGLRSVSTMTPVRTPSGGLAGTLRVEIGAPAVFGYRPQLLWTWGIAAGVTLLVFVAVYDRLRRHLRPVAAIERNLHSYAAGIEQELTALTLSDSLGNVARGWNQLIAQLSDLQRQQQLAAAGPGRQEEVLSRFESAAFRKVVDRLPFGVLCVAADQTVGYANESAAGLLARKTEELVGKTLAEVIEDPAVCQAVTGALARGGSGLAVDQVSQQGGHEVSLRFRVLPLSGRTGAGGSPDGALVAVEDIGQLREDQRARDNFLYHVTHELRTPLTNINAYTETLTKPGFDDEQTRKECYNVIVSETRRLSSLVENILSISQLEVGTARLDVGEVELVRLLRQIVQDNLGAADEKRIDLTLTMPPKVPKIRGDKQRLAVLLNNLIGNAVKYTPAGGTVQVALECTEQTVRIGVRDSGIGIAPEDQTHVFEKFYRAADDHVQEVTGTGLGLAIAHEVARLHGGEIHLESEVGQGSTFTVELPRSSTESATQGTEVST